MEETLNLKSFHTDVNRRASPRYQFQVDIENLSLNVPLRVICVVRRIVPQYGIGVSFVIPEQVDKRRFEALLIALARGADPTKTGAKRPQAKPDEPLLCFAAAATRRHSTA